MQISLGHVVLQRINVIEVAGQEDAFTLAHVFGFQNESFCFSLVELLLKRLYVCRQHPSLGEKAKVFWEVFAHGQQILCEAVLASHRIHAWKVVGSLVRLHSLEQGWEDRSVNEPKVPVVLLVCGGLHFTPTSNIVHYFVLSVENVHHDVSLGESDFRVPFVLD